MKLQPPVLRVVTILGENFLRIKVRKLTPILLAVIMAFSIFTIVPITASAATSGDFQYKVLEDGTAEITGYIGNAEMITIPSELDGYTVTSIGDSAFMICTSLASITIPDSVTGIGGGAFGYRVDYSNGFEIIKINDLQSMAIQAQRQ